MPNDPERVRDLFLAAIDLPLEARPEYLAASCSADDELRAEVEQLLAAHANPDSLLEPLSPNSPNATSVFESKVHPFAETATGIPGDTPTRRAESAVALGTVIAGRYSLVELIGEGGMGSVYLATQSEPVKRQVALKLIKTGMDSKAVLARFDAERQALALMDHPNIARIYDGGVTPLGQPFFVMELVNGVPLTEYCDAHRLSVDARLQLFVSVCQAVQHAHQKGIIHRDLKPGNVLVTEVDGRPTPKVIDFGVAKATELKLTDMSFADTGAIVGTPAYMSPEQADPSSMDIDTRTDVYALGVMLYELLTGSPPIDSNQFKRGAVLEMLRMVREVEPPRPSTKLSTADALPNIAANRSIEPAKLAKMLRGELDWVVMKALEKDRTRRYDSANGLAQDIQRYLADEVVEARPPSRGYRLKKFVKRNKVQVLAASLVLLALVGGITGTTWGLIREAARVMERDDAIGKRDTALGDAKEALDRESERVKERDYQLGISDFLLTVAAYGNADRLRASDRLDKVPKGQRGWEWAFLKQRVRGGLFTLYGHTGQVWSVSFSPDGARIVTGSSDKTAKVWDARTGTFLLDLNGHTGIVHSVGFSPDGARIVTGSEDKTVKVWDARTGTPLLDLKGHTGSVFGVNFSADGARIVTGSRDHTAKVWDARTGKPLLDLKAHTGPVGSVSFSPDGTRIVTGGGQRNKPGEVKVWDARTGTPLLDFKGHSDRVDAVSFSPDGTRIVTGSWDLTAKVWDAQTGTPLLNLQGHANVVFGVSFSPDGGRIATTSEDKTTKVWDARTGTSLLDLKGHTDAVVSVGFASDGTKIVTGSIDRTAMVWDARTGTPLLDLKGHTGEVTRVSFSPDGARIVTGSWDHTAKVWDARTGTPLLELKGHTGAVTSVGFSPDGTRIVTGSYDQTAKVWDARTGTPLLDLKGHTGKVQSVSFSPDGTRIVTGSFDHTAKVWDAHTGTPLLELKGHTHWVSSVSFSPDGAWIVTGSGDKVAKVWDARIGTLLLDLKGHASGVLSVCFSPKGTRIVTGSQDETAKVWDARAGTLLLDLNGHTDYVNSVCFSPDESRIVTGSGDKTAKVWDARTGTPLLEIRGHSNWVWSVSFSPDGTRIVTGSHDKTAKVWDARTGIPSFDLKGHTGTVFSVCFSPDGARIVTGNQDKTAKVWDVRTGTPLLDLKGHTGEVTRVSFSPDGARIVTGSADRTAKVWDARTGTPLLDLRGHTGGVTTVSFSPDGARIVTGSADRTAKVWDARTGTPLLDLKGHTGGVTTVSFSPNGARIVTDSLDNTTKVWDAKTGHELQGEFIPVNPRPNEFSPDGKLFAHHGIDRVGDRVVLIPLIVDAEERDYRLLHTRPNYWIYAEGFDAARAANDRFAAPFYLDRILSLPEHRTTARFAERNALHADPLVIARTNFHHPGLAKTPYDHGTVALLAVYGDRLARRLVAQQLLRDGKSGPAIPLLLTCMLSRPATSPPVEELLLAQAHLALNQPDEARRFYKAATEWLDRPRDPKDNLGVGFAPNGDPRRNPFNWEEWYECDVFRAGFRLSAMIRGEDKPADDAERLAFAWVAHDRKHFAFATRLWSETLASDPKLGDDRQTRPRYHAACSAVRAADGEGKDEPPRDDAARAKLRGQALDWLNAELTACGKDPSRLAVPPTLSQWKLDGDLAAIRDQEALAKLPADEQKAFARLWADVRSAVAAFEQVEAVRKELKTRDPRFNGIFTPMIEKDAVIGLNFDNNTTVSDLTPLKGMSLKSLRLMQTGVTDLTPLTGMPLEMLMLWMWRGSDLTPLKGMPLKWLNCGGGHQNPDLTPLAGLPLDFLCINITQVADLGPLKDVPLTQLLCSNTRVTDLTPLRKMRLRQLHLDNCKVSDLAPIQGMPLTDLEIQGTSVADLSPLKGMPLEDIRLTPKNITRGLEILRDMKSLKTIGIADDKSWPAAEFWARYDKGEFK